MSDSSYESAVEATLDFLRSIAKQRGLLVDGIDIGMQANLLLVRLDLTPGPDAPGACSLDGHPESIAITRDPRGDRLRLPDYSCRLWRLFAELLVSSSVANAAATTYGEGASRFAGDLDAALRDISRDRWLRECDDDDGDSELFDEAVDAAIAEAGEERRLDA
jgi:hypothetical protein